MTDSNDTTNVTEIECRFLSLSPELRNRVYNYTLVQASPINIPKKHRGSEEQLPLTAVPGLLGTNHQIRHEALGIFYGQNIFQSFTYNDFDAWIHGLPRAVLPMIKDARPFHACKFEDGEALVNVGEIVRYMVASLAVEDGLEGLQLSAVKYPVMKEGQEGQKVVKWLGAGEEWGVDA